MKIRLISIFFILFFIFFTIVVISDDIARVDIEPEKDVVGFNKSFDVDVVCYPNAEIKAFEFEIFFDSNILQANSVTEGNIFNAYDTFFNSGDIDNINGTITKIYDLTLGRNTINHIGTFVTINFTTKDISGSSYIDFNKLGVTNTHEYITIYSNNARIDVNTHAVEKSMWNIDSIQIICFVMLFTAIIYSLAMSFF